MQSGLTARPTTQALQRRNGIEQRQRLDRVVAIRAGQFDCQWDATPVTDQMALAAPFSSIGRIRPSLWPPKTARTDQLSTTARSGHHEKANSATRSESSLKFRH